MGDVHTPGLVLTRYVGEVICIGEDITVSVASIEAGGKVRLRVVAPKSVRVDRREVREDRERLARGDHR